MTKIEVLEIMINSLNNDNRDFSRMTGMSEEDIESQIQKSQQTIIYMMSNLYDKLRENKIII